MTVDLKVIQIILDSAVDTVFVWTTSGLPAVYTDWSTNTSPYSLTNNCVRLSIQTTTRYWIVDSCSNLNYALCQGSKL
jgi:hypothetical protein